MTSAGSVHVSTRPARAMLMPRMWPSRSTSGPPQSAGLIDVSCIPPAIESGQLAGAAIDVLPDEPPSADNPLIKAWRDPKHPAHHRVLVNPHAAFYCEQGLLEMRVKGAQSVRRALLGERLRNVVN